MSKILFLELYRNYAAVLLDTVATWSMFYLEFLTLVHHMILSHQVSGENICLQVNLIIDYMNYFLPQVLFLSIPHVQCDKVLNVLYYLL